MKNFIITALLAAALFAACSRREKNDAPIQAQEEPAQAELAVQEAAPAPIDPNGPDWQRDTPPADVLWAAGTAKAASLSMSMTVAQARAMAALSRTIQDLIKPALDEYQAAAAADPAVCSAIYEKAAAEMSKGVNLAGARTIKTWTAKDETVWLLVQYNKTSAKEVIMKAITTAAGSSFDLDKFSQILDAHLTESN